MTDDLLTVRLTPEQWAEVLRCIEGWPLNEGQADIRLYVPIAKQLLWEVPRHVLAASQKEDDRDRGLR